MSGGIAYVYDDDGQFPRSATRSMVELEKPDKPEDEETIKRLLENHYKFTGSPLAKAILDDCREGAAPIREGDADRLPRVLENQAEIGRRPRRNWPNDTLDIRRSVRTRRVMNWPRFRNLTRSFAVGRG